MGGVGRRVIGTSLFIPPLPPPSPLSIPKLPLDLQGAYSALFAAAFERMDSDSALLVVQLLQVWEVWEV